MYESQYDESASDFYEDEYVPITITKKIVRNIRDLLENKGWIKGDLHDENGYCLLGAWNEVVGEDSDHEETWEQFLKPIYKSLYPEYVLDGIPAFNDKEEIDFIDVKNVLEAAERAAE